MDTVGEVVVPVAAGFAAPADPAKTEAACGPTAPFAMNPWLRSVELNPCTLPKAAARAFGSTMLVPCKLFARSSIINCKARVS